MDVELSRGEWSGDTVLEWRKANLKNLSIGRAKPQQNGWLSIKLSSTNGATVSTARGRLSTVIVLFAPSQSAAQRVTTAMSAMLSACGAVQVKKDLF